MAQTWSSRTFSPLLMVVFRPFCSIKAGFTWEALFPASLGRDENRLQLWIPLPALRRAQYGIPELLVGTRLPFVPFCRLAIVFMQAETSPRSVASFAIDWPGCR